MSIKASFGPPIWKDGTGPIQKLAHYRVESIGASYDYPKWGSDLVSLPTEYTVIQSIEIVTVPVWRA